MFYYLSFLRPPPQLSSPTGPITVTPQVANDLRTELFDSDQDIFYSWLPSLPSSTVGELNFFGITKPQKLTTWRQGSAYKEILVPLPPGVRDGSSYSLVLTTHDQGYPHIINLAGPTCGARPLPVLSMPILFSSRRQDIGKQERIQRIYRIPTTPKDQVFLKLTEQTSFDLDKKVWDSGIGLGSWVVDLALSETLKDQERVLKDRLLGSDPVDVLELGAGTGIVSLVLGALRSTVQCENAGNGGRIVTTDLASAIPLLEHNVTQNDKLFSSALYSRPQALVLDWDAEELPVEVQGVEGGFDVIIMADVTYNTASFPALTCTLRRLIGLYNITHKSKPTLILLGYKERDPAERTLWDMAREIGIEFRRIGERVGAGGAPVEIWLGQVVNGEDVH